RPPHLLAWRHCCRCHHRLRRDSRRNRISCASQSSLRSPLRATRCLHRKDLMRIRSGGASALLLLALVGCAAAEPGPAHTPTDAGHGEIEGAQELSEPALHLTTVDAEGVVHHLDLLDEQSTVLAEIEPIDDLVTDGRYLFGIRPDSVTVIDSGVWTCSHIDHFHYYEAPSRVVGEIKGAGRAT